MRKIKRFMAFFPPLLLILLFIVATVLTPSSSTIYFDGAADQAEFSLRSDRQVAYDIKSDDFQNAEIAFGANKTEMMCAVEKLAPAELLQQVLDGNFDAIDWEESDVVFPFEDGTATLSCGSSLHLMLEVPKEGSFPYDMVITREKGGWQGVRNRIELKNFPEDLVIYLSASQDISMQGSSSKVMPAGIYRMTGCRSITFCAGPETSSPQDFKIGIEPHVNKPVEHFRFTNSEKDVFELTYFAETKFSEVGHVEVEGYVEKGKELTLEVSDIGQYPIPVKIYGRAGDLTMAGSTCYPNWTQWLLDKRSELLFSIVTLYIGIMFEQAQGKKSDPEGRGRTRPHRCQRSRRACRRHD